MRILSCCPWRYYSTTSGSSYEYESFVEVPRRMGHKVHHFEYKLAAAAGRDEMNDFFLSIVGRGAYDLVLIMTHRDEFLPEVLDEARLCSPTVAWNCDDDWKWAECSSRWVQHYTYMVTTYRHVYEANRVRYPNLLLSQWGCTGLNDGMDTRKDIDLSFVGLCYGPRGEQIKRLRKKLGLVALGRGVRDRGTWKTGVKRCIARAFRIPMEERGLELADQDAVKDIWNRSRISFTPLEGSRDGSLQIKARVFDMGLSGTLMLCTKNEALHEFYEPGIEYVEFDGMGDCIERAQYFLKHEAERLKIAEAYYRRTRGEHLWGHRFGKVFREMGLCSADGSA